MQTATPFDIVMRYCDEDQDKAVILAESLLYRPGVMSAVADSNRVRRRVLDFWLSCCRAPRTLEEMQLVERLRKADMMVTLSRYSRTPMNQSKLLLLLQMARETDAVIPLGLENAIPELAMVSCVQSTPHTIDRLLVETVKGVVHSISWNARRGGVTGMIGLRVGAPRYLAADRPTAARLQFALSAAGCGDEVASIFLDADAESSAQAWFAESHLLTLAVEEDEDLIRAQRWLDCFPRMETNVRAIWRSRIPGPSLRPASVVSWQHLKCSCIDAAIGASGLELSADAVRLIEQTGARHADIERLVRVYEAEGRRRIAQELRSMADNRILEVDKRSVIREAANAYTLETNSGVQPIANFVVRPQHAVVFPEREATFFQCQVRCGRLDEDILIPDAAVENVSSLQTAIRSQMITRGATLDSSPLPTVVNAEAMRRYVLKHLRGQVANLTSLQGICRVGWSDDRATFYTPGALVSLNGTSVRATPLHPQVTTLRCFSSVSEWSSSCPSDLAPACQDIIAMLLAMTVRSFKRWLPRPAIVAHSCDAAELLKGLSRAVGQHSVFELSHNVRDSGNIDGVKGYPFVASGYGKGQIVSARIPYMLLAEEGYHVASYIDSDRVEDAGRALQFGLLRVVEWCLATGAEDYTESASMDFNTSLMREGRWLMRNVCELQAWEVSARGDDKLEELFAQIPLTDTSERLTLIDGVTLSAKIGGLAWDAEALRLELLKVDAQLDETAETITAAASALLPALSKFYGCEPGTRHVVTELV